LWNKFGKFGADRAFFGRHQRYMYHWHKVAEDRDCTCPLDFWRVKHQKNCADRAELERLKFELQEEKLAKSRFGNEVNALKVKTENLQSKSMIAELEATRLHEEVAALKSKVDYLGKQLKAEQAQHTSTTEEARRARLRLYAQLQTERHHAKEDKRAKLALWSQLQAEKDARAGLTLERDSERRNAAAREEASLLEANRTANLTVQLREAKREVQRLTASIAANAHQPWAAGYGEHVSAVVVIVIVAVVCRLAGQADTDKAHVDKDGLLGAGNLKSEHEVDIFDKHSDSETLRFVTITCPGASHEDITVSSLFNGCAVAISCGEGPGWTKDFQFRPEDGCFEFQEDRVRLEQGMLVLAFRACPVASRIFQLPQDYALHEKEASSQDRSCGNITNTAISVEEAAPVPDPDDGSVATLDPTENVDNASSDGTSIEHAEAAEPAGIDQGGNMTVEDCANFWAADEEPPAIGTIGAASTDYLQAVPSQLVNDSPNDSPESGTSFEQISAVDDEEDFEIIFQEGADHRG